MRVVVLSVAASAAALALAACQGAVAPAAPDRAAIVARGEYLVTKLGMCGDCHSPMDPATGQVPAGKELAGANLIIAPTVPIPVWAPIAPPIAGLPAGYTEAQLATLLETGKRPGGDSPRPPMPAFRFDPEDAQAAAAYLASMKR